MELLFALVLLALVAAIAVPAVGALRDRVATTGAAAHAVRAFTDARDHAVRRARRTAVWLDSGAARLTLVAGTETLGVHPLGTLYGVQLRTTRDSVAWSATGLGYGAANTRLVLARGRAADTVTVSRLGRLRR